LLESFLIPGSIYISLNNSKEGNYAGNFTSCDTELTERILSGNFVAQIKGTDFSKRKFINLNQNQRLALFYH